MPEVHGLLPHDVHAHPLLLRLAQHVVLPRDVPQYGIRLEKMHMNPRSKGDNYSSEDKEKLINKSIEKRLKCLRVL